MKTLQLTSLCAKTCFPHTLRDVPKNTPIPKRFGARSDERKLTLKSDLGGGLPHQLAGNQGSITGG